MLLQLEPLLIFLYKILIIHLLSHSYVNKGVFELEMIYYFFHM